MESKQNYRNIARKSGEEREERRECVRKGEADRSWQLGVGGDFLWETAFF